MPPEIDMYPDLALNSVLKKAQQQIIEMQIHIKVTGR